MTPTVPPSPAQGEPAGVSRLRELADTLHNGWERDGDTEDEMRDAILSLIAARQQLAELQGTVREEWQDLCDAAIAERDEARKQLAEMRGAVQPRVHAWMLECFGAEIAADKRERSHRFIEEALELVQASGCSREEVLMLVDYTYGRAVGELQQEVGGVMVTLAALCNAHSIDMDKCADTEIARVWGKIDQIRQKQAGKPRGSPLPAALAPTSHAQARDHWACYLLREVGDQRPSPPQDDIRRDGDTVHVRLSGGEVPDHTITGLPDIVARLIADLRGLRKIDGRGDLVRNVHNGIIDRAIAALGEKGAR